MVEIERLVGIAWGGLASVAGSAVVDGLEALALGVVGGLEAVEGLPACDGLAAVEDLVGVA